MERGLYADEVDQDRAMTNFDISCVEAEGSATICSSP